MRALFVNNVTFDVEKGWDAKFLGGCECYGQVLDHLGLVSLREVELVGAKPCDQCTEG